MWATDVTMSHSETTSTNMSDGNNASKFGLDNTAWSVTAVPTGAATPLYPGLNKDGTIRLYYNATTSNSITVASSTGATINTITVTYGTQTKSGTTTHFNCGVVTAGGSTIDDSNDDDDIGQYAINNTSFTIANGNTTSVQVWIVSIVINYTPSGGSGSCAKPTFSPVAGTYNANQSVTISCGTTDATIYYTTDGNDPTTGSSVYSGAISVTTTTTIKALATKSGLSNSDIASATYVLQCATPTFSPSDATQYKSTQEVTITSTDGATIYYTTDGSDPTTGSSVYDPAAKPSISTATTIKALAVKSGWTDSEIGTADYKFVVTNTYNLATSITSGKHYIITNSKANGSAYGMGYQKSNNRDAVSISISSESTSIDSDKGVYEFLIQGPDKDGFYTIYDESETSKGYLYAASSSANHLKTKSTLDVNGKWKITFSSGVATIKAEDSSNRNWMRFNSNLFSCYESGYSDIYLFEKNGEANPEESVSITSSEGYATFASDNALDFTGKSIKVYYATANGKTGVTFHQIYKVPAREGVLLYSAGGATTIDIPVATAKDAVTNNVFKRGTGAAVASVSGDLHNYILNKVSGNLGFYKANGKTVAKNRAYIQIDESVNVKEFITLPGFDDDADGIDEVNGEGLMVNGPVYDLQGRRVQKPGKGLYIMNGKKVLF